MNTAPLKKFAQSARRRLMEQVSVKLTQVLETDSPELHRKGKAVRELRDEIRRTSRESVVDRVAYTWFNRFCALRFMDVNRYTFIGVVSPAGDHTQPEILHEAKQGHIEADLEGFLDTGVVFDLLAGRTPSPSPEREAYHLLLTAVCNHYNGIMPFMFPETADYTELLVPGDLLSERSVPASAREVLTAEVCTDVEVIGWLYQFYISEKKDEVFDDLKKNKKITAQNIPAATQLFTPHWIVRYLVENSLGRLWMLNRPGSALKERMDYYIEPEQPETGFLRIVSPEELKISDPACGSGHMLVYAFDLLYAIYEEEGYDAPEIPRLILEKNLYGIEIDERAGELAAFALVMKARGKYRRFFSKPVLPNICVLEDIKFESGELKEYIDEIGAGLFTLDFQTLLLQFEETANFGSLIRPAVTEVAEIRRILEEKNMGGKLFLASTHKRVLKVLKQADYLSPKYHIVIANPPYMGSKGMNENLKKFAQDNFADTKSDLFAMFVERIMVLIIGGGFIGLMTPFNWMFLSSFEKLRAKILNETTLTSLVRPELHAFFDSAYVSICGFTLFTKSLPDFSGAFIDLTDFYGADLQPIKALEAIRNHDCGWFYRASATYLKKIPGSPIAYWVKGCYLFEQNTINDYFISGGRNKTHDNEKYMRFFWEISTNNNIWKLYANGGDFRKFYGNELQVINWSDEAKAFYDSHGGLCNSKFWGKEGITWSLITSANTSFRIKRTICQYSSGAPTIFNEQFKCDKKALAFLNSTIARYYLKALNPTLNTTVNDVFSLPFLKEQIDEAIISTTEHCIIISHIDWDSYERSWDFTDLPLLREEFRTDSFADSYEALREKWRHMTMQMKQLEEENNRIFIHAYGLQNEMTPDVPLEEITLTSNPYYRYGKGKNDRELEKLLLADTIKEFISYAVGCMFGRYSIDKPGLILADQGETLHHYLARVPTPTFPPDEDNVIPLLDRDWFIDDIAGRFHKFLRITFGETNYTENLETIETALGKDIRKYFLTDFYRDHIKTYKKRPIYWLFSSPSGSFNALIYMHRYRPDTVSVVLNDYLREFRTKLTARLTQLEHTRDSGASSNMEKTTARKELEKIKRMVLELESWEREVLYPLATHQVCLDLDDGVKVNYPKLGKALKRIPGLS